MEIFGDSFEFDGEHIDRLAVDVEGNVIQIVAYDEDLETVSVMVNNHVAQMSIEEADRFIAYWL